MRSFVFVLLPAVTLCLFALGGTAGAGPVAAPELDPGTAMSGLALLAGGFLLLLERYRRRR